MTFSTKTDGYFNQMVLIAVFICIFSCGCQTNNKTNGPSAFEDHQSIRKTRILSNNWRFQLDIRNIGENEGWFKDDFERINWAKVTVPQAWDCYETVLWGYEGIGWYSKIINLRR